MNDQQNKQGPFSGCLGLFLYVFCFAVVTSALIYLCLPRYGEQAAFVIAICAALLFFAIPSFGTGWQWDNPAWTLEARYHAKIFGMHMPLIPLLHIGSGKIDFTMLLLEITCCASAILLPFFLGRTMNRWWRQKYPGKEQWLVYKGEETDLLAMFLYGPLFALASAFIYLFALPVSPRIVLLPLEIKVILFSLTLGYLAYAIQSLLRRSEERNRQLEALVPLFLMLFAFFGVFNLYCRFSSWLPFKQMLDFAASMIKGSADPQQYFVLLIFTTFIITGYLLGIRFPARRESEQIENLTEKVV